MAGATHFQSAVYPLALGGLTVPGYAALYALVLNLVVSIVLSALLNGARLGLGPDETAARDYRFDPARAG